MSLARLWELIQNVNRERQRTHRKSWTCWHRLDSAEAQRRFKNVVVEPLPNICRIDMPVVEFMQLEKTDFFALPLDKRPLTVRLDLCLGGVPALALIAVHFSSRSLLFLLRLVHEEEGGHAQQTTGEDAHCRADRRPLMNHW